MHRCRHCGQAFHPPQTFRNLFTRPRVCSPCELIGSRPIRLEKLPLQGGELILFTHDHAPHPVLFNDAFETLVRQNAYILFYDSIEHAPKEAYPILGGLFDPLVLYHPEFPTLDRLETLLHRFDGNV